MTDCKNCKYTDEYCASGDCPTSQSPRNDLATTSQVTDLTEQWKKGELKLGEHYYYTTIFSPTVHIQNFTRDVVSFQDFKETVAEVIAPVPSYEEWQAKLEENAQLKELLKECREVIKNVDTYYGNYDSTNGYLVINKINEALK